jgi:hypothetical protein
MIGLALRFNTSIAIVLLSIITIHSSVLARNSEQELKEPQVVVPAKKGKAPSDAIVLFDKGSLDKFESIEGKGAAKWKVSGRKFTVVPGTSNIQTKERFGDCQLHIEWRTPPKDVRDGKEGQGCGNSGIYIMGKYEVQVLNSFINKTDYNRMAGSIYKEHSPLVNSSLKPGKWQTYDIIFTAPVYDEDQFVISKARLTVIHNGVLIQNNVEVNRPTQAYSKEFPIHEPELPLMLQNHSNEVSYRNIWIRRL